jgi:soluble lytic murein transglycosylase-like protein
VGAGGRCTNWPVRGVTPRQLRDPDRNIRAAIEILAYMQKTAGALYLAAYNGHASPASPYPAKVRAVEAAYRGEHQRSKSRRVRRLVALIRRVAP